MRTKKDIDDLLKYGERVTLECKLATGGLPRSVWETYSSFANTVGGTILLGIEEHLDAIETTERFEIKGISKPERLLKEFWDMVNNSEKISMNLLTDANVEKIQYGDATIIWIEIPQADSSQRPVYVNGNPYKGTYRRNHEGDYHCSQGDVRAMIRDSNENGIDSALIEHYTMEDIDLDTLQAYRNAFDTRNPDHTWRGLSHADFLRRMGGMDTDRNTGKEWLTLAGLLMFGKGLSIRNRFDNIRMDYLDMTNLLPDSRWSDRLTYDGLWENNLFNFFRKVLPKLTSDLKRPFHLEGTVRIDDTPAHRAVREALVNLIIHSDFMLNGILRVEKREHEFFFSNPGSLKLPVREIFRGGFSKARNPRMQAMFRMLGYGDNIGSGFPTILSACKGENWRKPDLYDLLDLQVVELHLWMVSLLPKEATDYLRHWLGDYYETLSTNEQLILATTYLEGEVSNYRLQAILDLHRTDIGILLSDMSDKKQLLVKDSRGRWTTYRLNQVFQPPKNDGMKVSDIVSDIVSDTVSDTVILQIFDYCEKPRSTNEIMALLGLKHKTHFINTFLNPLLKSEYLERTIPAKPQSRLQKYKITERGRQRMINLKNTLKQPPNAG